MGKAREASSRLLGEARLLSTRHPAGAAAADTGDGDGDGDAVDGGAAAAAKAAACSWGGLLSLGTVVRRSTGRLKLELGTVPDALPLPPPCPCVVSATATVAHSPTVTHVRGRSDPPAAPGAGGGSHCGR